MRQRPYSLFIIAVLVILFKTAAGQADLQQQRRAVLEAASRGAAGLTILKQAMTSPDALIRRTAVRSMGTIGASAHPALLEAFRNDPDELVRRSALRFLVENQVADSFEMIETSLADSSRLVRLAAIEALGVLRPYHARTAALLRKAQQDKDPMVSQAASRTLWPFHKDAISVRERPENKDHQLSVVQRIGLPFAGWKFRTDNDQTGQLNNWFSADYNDQAWTNISISKGWTEQGHPYHGVAWYRVSLTLPAKPDSHGTDLVFEGVDERAWIWINGRYAGAYDPAGAGPGFAADAGDLLKWESENQITVRVQNRTGAGGILKPVTLEIVK